MICSSEPDRNHLENGWWGGGGIHTSGIRSVVSRGNNFFLLVCMKEKAPLNSLTLGKKESATNLMLEMVFPHVSFLN